jgi:hypothetical protein
MSIIERLASSMGKRDEAPNQALARELAEKEDREGIEEAAALLSHEEKRIQSDCIKVLYETGYLNPELIAPYVNEFLKLLKSRHNRLVWGGMIALSTIAAIKAEEIFTRVDEIYKAIEKGSVITVDSGIKTLSLVASTRKEFQDSIFPYLIKHLEQCRPKEIPMHAEFIFHAVDVSHKEEFIAALYRRKDVLTDQQLKRINKLLEKIKKL